ncbi:hypothetical protein CLOLEP_01839 [[Clostridium] leptum DSM 753]|uniref:Uncharacterized protein n=1 Tax=[Clostridium] leptum DSM 753 TaxID=428125 RepID=A7VTE7_9FIRM|nr:hypothetical protein CLOLEP_01839 [[Clostridium] leptum DSM 753]
MRKIPHNLIDWREYKTSKDQIIFLLKFYKGILRKVIDNFCCFL